MRDLTLTIARGILLTVILPLVPVFIFNISLPSALALITGTFVIEYGAAALGVGMGLNPLYILYTLTFVALGVTLTMFDIFNLLGQAFRKGITVFGNVFRTGRAFSVFEKIRDLWSGSVCDDPGILCLPSGILGDGVATEQVYILLIMGGYIIISIVTILATVGFFRIIGIG